MRYIGSKLLAICLILGATGIPSSVSGTVLNESTPLASVPDLSALAEHEMPMANDYRDSTETALMPSGGEDYLTTKNDVERIGLPSGNVQSVPAEWIEDSLGSSRSSGAKWASDSLVVDSEYGTYVFRIDSSDFQLLIPGGTTSVTSSYFTVEVGSEIAERGQSRIIATQDLYGLIYELFLRGNSIGNLTVTMNFNTTNPPKITATLDLNTEQSNNIRAWRIIWVVCTPFEAISERVGSYQYWAARERVLSKETTRVWIGEFQGINEWHERVMVDWSGETATSNLAQMIGDGNRLIIRFMAGKMIIDPIIVASGADNGGLESSTQRKVISVGDRIWIFYLNGGNIVYRSGRLVKDASSLMQWDDVEKAADGPIMTSFDLANAGNVVALLWRNTQSKMFLRVGVIDGNNVHWGDVKSVADPVAAMSPPAIAIHPGNRLWVAASVQEGSPPIDILRIYSLQDFGEGPTTAEGWQISGIAYPSLLTFPDGAAMCVFVIAGSGNINWATWHKDRGPVSGWLSIGSYAAGVDSSKGSDSFSAVGTERNSPEYRLYGHVTYIQSSTQKTAYLKIVVQDIHNSGWVDTWSSAVLSPENTQGAYPTISVDLNGDLNAFWIWKEQLSPGVFFYHMYHARTAPGRVWTWPPLWKLPATEFTATTTYERKSLSAIYLSMESLFIVWQEASSLIKLAFLPLPSSSASAAPEPWARPGLSKDSPFTANGDEYVALGTGQLIVRQQDILIPGVGMDFEISRIYAQPPVLDGYTPYGYDDYPWAPIGFGWRLNFPWITDTFVHWMDGQRYLIRWRESASNEWTFENHQGTNFKLKSIYQGYDSYYLLTVSSGIRYRFDSDGKLTLITDTYGNTISFGYDAGKISTIVDTLGRPYTFEYNTGFPVGYLKKITYGPLGAEKSMSYEYYTGGFWNLYRVINQVGRSTTYDYLWTESNYILNEITYPTGGHVEYGYQECYVGSDATKFLVTSQDVYESTGNLIRSTTFDYEVVWGRVTFARIIAYGKVGALLIEQGFSDYLFNSQTGKIETRTFNSAGYSGGLHDRMKSWYTPTGSASLQEHIIGEGVLYHNALQYPVQPSYFTNSSFDEWGNLVYSRDAVGHETFASYANTESQNSLKAPGSFARISSGRYFDIDFSEREDWMREGWTKIGQGTATIDREVFMSSSPSLRLSAQSSDITLLYDVTNMGVSSGYFEFLVRPGSQREFHEIALCGYGSCASGNDGRQAVLRFDTDDWIKKGNADGSWEAIYPFVFYKSSEWLRLGMWRYTNAQNEHVWDFWLNGVKVQEGIPVIIDPYHPEALVYFIKIAVHSTSSAKTMWLAGLKAYSSKEITVTGLQYGMSVRLRSADGSIRGQKKVPYGASSVAVAPAQLFPDMRLEVLGLDFGLETQSPFAEVWGGDVYAYNRPWSLSGLSRVTNGFVAALGGRIILDDQLPSGGGQGGNEFPPWPWTDGDETWHPLPVSGQKLHYGKYNFWLGDHWYYGDSAITPLPYAVQFAYIRAGETPNELMLQYCVWPDGASSCDWGHRPYWGVDNIQLSSTTYMGSMPEARDQWVMLVVKSSDISLNTVKGMAFDHHGGNVSWDYSGFTPEYSYYGDVGEITITNAPNICRVDLLDDEGNIIVSENGPHNPGAYFDLRLYEANPPVRAFPIHGQFKLYSSCGPSPVLEYSSELYQNLWGGDIFQYNNPGFYENSVLGTDLKNRPIGILEFQTGRGEVPEVRQLTFINYDNAGFPVQVKKSHDSGWIEVPPQIRDSRGRIIYSEDPESHKVYYEYSHDSVEYPCSHDNVIKEKHDMTGGIWIINQNIYDCHTGLLRRNVNPKSYITDYSQDDLGRLVLVVYPNVGGVGSSASYQYDDINRIVTSIDENGDIAKQAYDGLGRITAFKRYTHQGLLYSSATKSYNWQDLTSNEVSPEGVSTTYSYDLFGRMVRRTNDADGSHMDILYEDEYWGNKQTIKDENLHEKNNFYDLRGALTEVWEHNGVLTYSTKYSYDEVGNLLSVRDAKNPAETTYHVYDDLNRLVLTTYPDGKTTSMTYYDDGNIETRTQGSIKTIFTYDSMHRMTLASFWDVLNIERVRFTYVYDLNSNLETSDSTYPNGGALGGTTHYEYNERDRITLMDVAVHFDRNNQICGEIPPAPAVIRTFHFGWTLDGNINSIQYPDGYAVNYVYDDFDRVKEIPGIINPVAGQDGIIYNRDDQVKTINFARTPGVPYWDSSYDYDSRGRLDSINHDQNGIPSLSLGYTYYLDNNIHFVTRGAVTEEYDYDGLDRLTYASDGTFWDITYQYDPAGNRQQQARNGVITAYAYLSYNRLDSFTTLGQTTSYGYDAHDNVVLKVPPMPGTSWAYVYDKANRMISVEHPQGTKIQCYGYDAEGRRIRSEHMSSGPRLRDLWFGSLLLSEENVDTGVSTDYIYLGDMLVAKTGLLLHDIWYYFHDHLGSTRLVVQKSTGLIVFSTNYEPFGTEVPGGIGQEKIKYIQMPWDTDIGLSYLLNRYFDPILGRFLTLDSVLGALLTPQTLNRYTYVANNPLRCRDSTGEGCSWAPWDWGACLSDAATAIGNWWNGLDPNIRGAIILVAVVAAIIVTGGLAAGPLAGTAIGSILMSAAVGATIGAVTDALVYTGVTLATGGEWSLEGMANAAAVGAIVGGVTAGLGKAISLWRVGALGARVGSAATGMSDDAADFALSNGRRLQHGYNRFLTRSPLDAGKLGLTGKWSADRALWTSINRQLLTSPGGTLSSTLGGVPVQAYVGTVRGVQLVSYVYSAGPYVGLYATTAIPFSSQLTALAALSFWGWM